MFLDCHLNEDNFMPASKLRNCLRHLGSSSTVPIEYIETHYGATNALDKICNAITPGMTFDSSRTHAQPNSCSTGRSAYTYPGYCLAWYSRGWLGDNCLNGCGNVNYAGFYCKT